MEIPNAVKWNITEIDVFAKGVPAIPFPFDDDFFAEFLTGHFRKRYREIDERLNELDGIPLLEYIAHWEEFAEKMYRQMDLLGVIKQNDHLFNEQHKDFISFCDLCLDIVASIERTITEKKNYLRRMKKLRDESGIQQEQKPLSQKFDEAIDTDADDLKLLSEFLDEKKAFFDSSKDDIATFYPITPEVQFRLTDPKGSKQPPSLEFAEKIIVSKYSEDVFNEQIESRRYLAEEIVEGMKFLIHHLKYDIKRFKKICPNGFEEILPEYKRLKNLLPKLEEIYENFELMASIGKTDYRTPQPENIGIKPQPLDQITNATLHALRQAYPNFYPQQPEKICDTKPEAEEEPTPQPPKIGIKPTIEIIPYIPDHWKGRVIKEEFPELIKPRGVSALARLMEMNRQRFTDYEEQGTPPNKEERGHTRRFILSKLSEK